MLNSVADRIIMDIYHPVPVSSLGKTLVAKVAHSLSETDNPRYLQQYKAGPFLPSKREPSTSFASTIWISITNSMLNNYHATPDQHNNHWQTALLFCKCDINTSSKGVLGPQAFSTICTQIIDHHKWGSIFSENKCPGFGLNNHLPQPLGTSNLPPIPCTSCQICNAIFRNRFISQWNDILKTCGLMPQECTFFA